MNVTLAPRARTIAASASSAGNGSGDPILYWNGVALEANRISHSNGAGEQTGPTLSSRALAIVHLAMYDAFAAFTNNPLTLPAYLPGLPTPPTGAGIDAAVAGAAHTALTALFPTQTAAFTAALLFAGLPVAGRTDGFAFGRLVAQRLLADRAGDPSAGSEDHVPSTERGRHRPDPNNPGQGFHGRFYGERAKGFAITRRHTLDAPPQPVASDVKYRAALRDVRAKGIKPELTATLPGGSVARTPTETLIGLYWAYDGAAGLGTPPRLYNQIVREVAIAQGNTVADNARLFAFVNAAMADAGILAWDEKYRHDLWRPVLGIREHDLESRSPNGPEGDDLDADADPFWLPLGAPKTNGDPATDRDFTPNFPAYPSGHATFGAAALHITRLFYGIESGNRCNDNLFSGLSFVSEELNGVNRDVAGAVRPLQSRSFPGGLWQMILENGLSRVLLGVHWVFDAYAVDGDGEPDLARNIGGVPLGLKIAEDIYAATGGLAPAKSTVSPRV